MVEPVGSSNDEGGKEKSFHERSIDAGGCVLADFDRSSNLYLCPHNVELVTPESMVIFSECMERELVREIQRAREDTCERVAAGYTRQIR